MSEETEHNIRDRAGETGPRRGSAGKTRATVLQILPALNAGGGVERGTFEVARAISEAGGRSLVVSAGGDMLHEIARARAEHFTLPVDRKNPFVMRANVKRIERLIADEDVDIVHARSRAPAWSAWAAARRANKPLVTTFHGTYSAGNPLKRKYNSVMTFGDRVIAISNFIAGHVRQVYGVPASKIRVIPRGVDLGRFDPALVSAERVALLANKWRLGDGNPVIMLPGRLTRWKGQTVFLEAISRLGRKDIRCVLVGSDQGRRDYRRELNDLIARHDLGGVVRIVDHCNDMPAAYMLTDLVVSASTDPEAFGRVIPEAQALGRPVIASDHGGARETVIPGETGWLTPPGDAAALAAAIGQVLDLNEPARHRLADRAISNVRQNFSKDAMCARTLDVYNEVLDLKRPA